MEKITKDFYLVEDWVDFDKSSLESISREYFTKKGMDAFVKKGKRKNIKMGKWRKRINQWAQIREFNFFMI